MSGFLLDTNVPSELIRPAPEAAVKAWLAAQPLDILFISAVSFGELRKGITMREHGKRREQLERWIEDDLPRLFSDGILPLTKAIAERWGVLDANRQMAGRPLSVPDGQIAAMALEHGLALVTRNKRDFEGLGLEIVDPWERSPGAAELTL